MVTEVRLVVISWGRGVMPERERSSRNMMYLDVDDDYMGIYKCENSSDYAFMISTPYAMLHVCYTSEIQNILA